MVNPKGTYFKSDNANMLISKINFKKTLKRLIKHESNYVLGYRNFIKSIKIQNQSRLNVNLKVFMPNA